MTLTLALLGLLSPFPTRLQGRGSPLHLARIETSHSLSFSSLADWDSTWCEGKPPLLPASCGFLATFIINFALPGTPARDVPPNVTSWSLHGHLWPPEIIALLSEAKH